MNTLASDVNWYNSEDILLRKKKKKINWLATFPEKGTSTNPPHSERNALAPQLVLGKLRNMPVTSLRAVFLS